MEGSHGKTFIVRPEWLRDATRQAGIGSRRQARRGVFSDEGRCTVQGGRSRHAQPVASRASGIRTGETGVLREAALLFD
jgi:hypothetical protein